MLVWVPTPLIRTRRRSSTTLKGPIRKFFIFDALCGSVRRAGMSFGLLALAGLLACYDLTLGDGALAGNARREVAAAFDAIDDWGEDLWSQIGLPV